MFEFGDKFRGKYDESVEAVKSYYASVSGYMDELLWGAMWLSKATDNDKYLQYVINNAENFGGIGWAITEFSWDVKYAGLQVMASKVKFFFFFSLLFFKLSLDLSLMGVPILHYLLLFIFSFVFFRRLVTCLVITLSNL